MSEYGDNFKDLPKYRKKELLKVLKNPYFWGQAYLQNRDGKDRRYWPHQAEDLQCRDRQIIHLDGRDVGKTVNIATLALHKAFTTKGGQVLVATPHQGHLDTIIDEVEWQIENNPDLTSSIAINNQGRPKIIRKPYFRIEWKNGSVIFFRPAGAYGDSFRSLHVNMILVDEGAWIPEKAWKALRQCLIQAGVFRIYSTPNGLRDTTYFRLTASDRWKLFKIPSWENPSWTKNREIELLEFYGGIESAGWQHEVAGVHGKPTYGAFNIEHFKLSQVAIDNYQLVEITQDHLKDCENESEVMDRIDMLLNLIPQNNAEFAFWVGSDTGYVNDPTEIVVFREFIATKGIEVTKDKEWNRVLVFSKTKRGANRLVKNLEGAKINAAAIHGNKSQSARTKALAGFKAGRINILVATDIAARGIDIDQLPQVVNFDLPNVPEDYIHRIGRTGRAGLTGRAVSLVSADEFNLLSDIERLTQILLERITIEGFVPVHALPISYLRTPSKSKKPKKEKTEHHDGQQDIKNTRSANKPTSKYKPRNKNRGGNPTSNNQNSGGPPKGKNSGTRRSPNR